jgi:poly(hydroxyalkanoate) depolymerase family esterase
MLLGTACVTSQSVQTVVTGTPTKIMPTTTHGTFVGETGSRNFVVYRPATFPTAHDARSLVVMLHGCTQSADDFAAGTRMNSAADSNAFLVLYPEQPTTSHPQKCWNWYSPNEFLRGKGEIAILAALIDSVASAEGIAPRHVALVGMSAGAAMAANLAVAYPERFAALAMHSGVAALAASDITSALVAMREGARDSEALGARALAAMGPRATPIPVIVLHGDADKVVAPANLHAIVQQWTAVNASAPSGRAPIEEHLFPGVGHAWSGGSAAGSYTAPAGPSATDLVVSFLRRVGAIR